MWTLRIQYCGRILYEFDVDSVVSCNVDPCSSYPWASCLMAHQYQASLELR